MGFLEAIGLKSAPAAQIVPSVTDADVRDYIARKGALERTVSAPIAFHPTTQYAGLRGKQPTAALLLQEALGWFDIGVRAVASRMSALELQACEPIMQDGVESLRVLPKTHPLSRLLRTFSPTHPPHLALRLTAQYMTTVGESYLLKVGNSDREPRELHMMSPARVQPVFRGGGVAGYVATGGDGQQIQLRAEDVIRTWFPDPETLYSAEGYLGPQAIAADAAKFAGETLVTHFESNAVPPVVIELASDAVYPEPDVQATWETSWMQKYARRTGSARGLPAMLPPGFVAKVLDGALDGAQVIALVTMWRDQILAALGVPKSVLGMTDDAGLGRATAEVNVYVMDMHAVTPIVDAFCGALTSSLARPDFGDELCIRVKPFVQVDKDFEIRREDQDLRQKVRSINEVRRERGAKPVNWGDLPVGTFSDAPYTGDEAEPIGPDDPDALDDGEDDDEDRGADVGVASHGAAGGARLLSRAASPARLEWGRVLVRERTFVPRFRDQYRAVLRAQERAVLESLAELDRARGERDVTVAQIVEAVRKATLAKRWKKLFELRTEPVRKAAMQSSGKDALSSVGSKDAFIFTERVKVALAKQAAEFREQVSRTTVKRATSKIIEAMKASVAAGESLSQRTARIKAAVGQGFEVRRKEAQTIARTEMLKATQRAQVEGYVQSGVVERKRWNTSQDDAVRDAHEIDGQEVALDEDFVLRDGASGSEPGASSLPVEDVVNCRCFLTPVLED